MYLSYYQYFQLFSLLMALLCRKGLNYFGLGILLPMMVVTNLTETLGMNYKLFFTLPRNHFIYNIYYLLLTPMYFYLFASMLGGNMAERRRLRWIALAIEIFLVFNFCFVQGWNDFNTFSALLVATVCIILSCLVLARLTMRKNDEAGLLHDPSFWINSLILLFNLVSLIILGMYKYIVTNHLGIRDQNLYLAIMPAANAVFYAGLGCAFLLCQLQKNK
jgi:hypothetical protein